MPSFIQTLRRLLVISQQVVNWAWALSIGVLSLCALPWFEFARHEHIWPTIATVVLLTGIKFGPAYFSARAFFEKFGHWVSRLLAARRKLAAWLVVAWLLLIWLPWLVILPLMGLANLYETIADIPYRSPSTAQWLFRRDYATVQLRLKTPGNTYNPSRWRAIVVWPLTPFFNFITDLPDGQPDASWTVVSVPTPPLKQLPEGTLAWQTDLLHEADLERKQLAERRRRDAADAARVFDTLHFELDESDAFFGQDRNSRFARSPLSDTLKNPALYARLSPNQVLLVRTTALGNFTEVFALAITGFKGTGRYDLGDPPPPTSPDITGSGYAELLRRKQGLEVTYVSTNASPVQVVITRYDPVQQIIAGTFNGVLSDPAGQRITVKKGAFEVQYRPFRVITPN